MGITKQRYQILRQSRITEIAKKKMALLIHFLVAMATIFLMMANVTECCKQLREKRSPEIEQKNSGLEALAKLMNLKAQSSEARQAGKEADFPNSKLRQQRCICEGKPWCLGVVASHQFKEVVVN